VHAQDTATSVDGFSGARGPRVAARLETLLGDAFVPNR